jgi:hypothetical protein
VEGEVVIPIGNAGPVRRLALGAGLACLSASVLLLEIALTRYFSFRLWYHYAFMIISIAMLGLTGATVALAVWRKRFEQVRFERFVAACALLAGAAVVAALPALALLNRVWTRGGAGSVAGALVLVAGYWVVLVVPFGFAGAGIDWVIGKNAESAPTLYAFDLIGAALGCLAAVALLSTLVPERALGAAAALTAIAALLFVGESAAERRRLAPWILAALLGALAALVGGDRLLGDRVTPEKGLAKAVSRGARLIATRPSINGRVDVAFLPGWHLVWGATTTSGRDLPAPLQLYIDGDAPTSIMEWSAGSPPLRFLDAMPASLAYAVASPRKVPITGAGGGMDVLNALAHGAERVVAVDINKAILDLVAGPFSKFSGHRYRDPRVSVVHSDGRNYAQGSREEFDLVQTTLVDSFAAISSGALTLSEDFLYTTEGFRVYFRALGPSGLLALGRTVRERLSLVAMIDAAARAEGFDLAPRLLVASNPQNAFGLVVLLQKTPFAAEQLEAAGEFLRGTDLALDYAPGRAIDRELAGLFAAEDRAGYVATFSERVRVITPESDDAPFYFRSSKWSALVGTCGGAKGQLLLILAVAVAFVLLGVLLPLYRIAGDALPGNGDALAYFFLVGLGFMALEIGLLVRLGLVLGHPARAITVALFGLPRSTGVGSAFARRWLRGAEESSAEIARRLMGLLFAVALVALLSWRLQPRVIDTIIGWPLGGRLAAVTLWIAPLGILLGAPMSLGLRALGRSQESLVLWEWGPNGAASVLGSVVTVLVSRQLGFGSAFVLAAPCYGLAAPSVRRARGSAGHAPAQPK